MSSNKAALGMPFIVTTDTKQVDSETRQRIRSHVMMGKTWKQSRNRKPAEPTKSVAVSSPPQHPNDSPLALPAIPSPSNSRPVCSNRVFFRFADSSDASMLEDLWKFSHTARRIFFPLESFIVPPEDFRLIGLWFRALAVDAAYFNAIAVITRLCRDTALSSGIATTGKGINMYFVKTVSLLRERLAKYDKPVAISNTTIMVVLALAMHAHITGDIVSARHHAGGLRKIVDLRGGMIKLIETERKLPSELPKCDLAVALHAGAKPFFFDDGLFMSYPGLALPFVLKENHISEPEDDADGFINITDKELARAWKVMKRFCTLINLAAATKHTVPRETIVETTASVVYRLFHMSFRPDSADEMMRLGLLAFCSHVFFQWRGIKASYPPVIKAYKHCFDRLAASARLPPQILFWLLMIAGIAVFNEANNDWLRWNLGTQVELCGVEQWTEARDILKSYLWIDFLHDKPGKATLRCALR